MAEKKVAHKKAKAKHAKAAPGKPNVYGLDGKVAGEVDLPETFLTEYRPDLIRRAVVSMEANARQPYAPKATAGMRHAVETWGA